MSTDSNYVREGTTTVKTESGETFETTLWQYDPDCEHLLDPHNWSGMKCLHCGGWFCY